MSGESKSTDALPLAVFLMGPTASGKTDLAVDLVQALPFEIISVDSALVYRGMDIGTAKPDAEVLSKAPHRLIDICDPAEAYSAARFREDALKEMEQIHASGRIPLLVGGTMLYFRALQYGLSELPEANPEIRRQLEEEAAEQGWSALHQRLVLVDPEAAERIHPNDPQRIQRALEVYALTGKPLSVLQNQATTQKLPYRLVKIACAPKDRALLHRRIEQRFHQMLDQGFEQEVKGLLSRGDLKLDLPSMRSVGYRQMAMYIKGELSFDDMVHKAIVATRQLAKRQLTWLRADGEVQWLDVEKGDLKARALKLIEQAPI